MTSNNGVTYETNAQYAERMARLANLKKLNSELEAAITGAIAAIDRVSPRVAAPIIAEQAVRAEKEPELPPATIPEHPPRVRRRHRGPRPATEEDFGLRSK